VIDETLLETIDKMDKAVTHVQSQFLTVRTGRAAPALVEKLMVEYYGSEVPLQQLAGFQVPEARQLIVKPHDRTALTAIERAIRDSDLGLSPSNDGVVIRLNFPPLTEERRKEYVKLARAKAEDARIAIRNVRRRAKDTLDKLAKDGEVGEDDVFRADKELDALTKKHVDAIDHLLAGKESELLEV
jgi:ribosome recycling factor